MAKLKENSARPRRPLLNRENVNAVMDAISGYDIAASPSWSDLKALSTNTRLDQIEAIPEGIFETDHGFSATATVYVTLQYGDKRDKFSSVDAFPAQVEGHFNRMGSHITASVDSFAVDTSSFYA